MAVIYFLCVLAGLGQRELQSLRFLSASCYLFYSFPSASLSILFLDQVYFSERMMRERSSVKLKLP